MRMAAACRRRVSINASAVPGYGVCAKKFLDRLVTMAVSHASWCLAAARGDREANEREEMP
jgi:hypothetical protein